MLLLEGVRNADDMKIPVQLNYKDIQGLSNEIRGKLSEVRPESIGQASRIQGVPMFDADAIPVKAASGDRTA